MRTSIVISLLVCSSLLVSCGGKLPRIKEPETLRNDCANIYNQFSNEARTNGLGHFVSGFIPKEKWTSSILALRPFQVTKSKYGVRIWIYADKNYRVGIVGYYVFINPAKQPPSVPLYSWGTASQEDRLYFKKTRFSGIYEFEEPAIDIK